MHNNGEVYGEIRLSIRRNTDQTDECGAIRESENTISEELVLELIQEKLASIGLKIHNCDVEFNRLFVDDEF